MLSRSDWEKFTSISEILYIMKELKLLLKKTAVFFILINLYFLKKPRIVFNNTLMAYKLVVRFTFKYYRI